MSDFLYIPVVSLNFNNLFATESISPPIHYSKRNFGAKRYVDLNGNPHIDHILLYTSPPKFLVDNVDSDASLFFIQFKKKELIDDLTLVSDLGGDQIFCTSQTIYFNFYDTSFVFLSDSERRKLMSRSVLAFETKTVFKYEKKFQLLTEIKNEAKDFDILSIDLPPVMEVDELITKDAKINRIKGLIYGYFLGRMFPDSPEYIEIKSGMQSLHNLWGAYKNEVGMKGATFKKKGFAAVYMAADKTIFEKMDACYSELSALVKSYLPGENEDSFVRNYLNGKIEADKIDDFLIQLKKVPALHIALKTIAGENQSDLFYLLNSIRDSILSYASLSETPNQSGSAHRKEQIDSRMKEAIYRFNKQLDILKHRKSEALAPPALESIEFTGDGIKVSGTELKLEPQDLDLFELILNALYRKGKSKVGELAQQEKLENVKIIGHLVKERFGEDSNARKYLLHLYSALNNKLDNTFDITLSQFSSLTNFAAFMIKPDSMEQLSDFLDSKFIKDKYIAYSYWGVFNGFATMGRTFTKYIFEFSNYNMIQTIDSYLKSICAQEETKSSQQPVKAKEKGKNAETKKVIAENKVESVNGTENPFAHIENSADLQQFSNWVKDWFETSIRELNFGNTESTGINLDNLKEGFMKSFLAKKKKGHSKENAKKLLRNIDFHGVIRKYQLK
jgi:hypothetical protein